MIIWPFDCSASGRFCELPRNFLLKSSIESGNRFKNFMTPYTAFIVSGIDNGTIFSEVYGILKKKDHIKYDKQLCSDNSETKCLQ
jgi:hypothetical protein